jgi:protein phosphatase
MVRAEELRDVLLKCKDPLDACKELTDRANRAGGHDNITVIVADFDGTSLPPKDSDGELSYKKYALPDVSPAESAPRIPAVPSEVTTAPLSEEAQRESRRLRVGHTMVGIQFSLPDAVRASNPGSELREAPEFGAQDEPVSLPISGLPPAAVGAMVLAAMILVALTGFLLLK